MKQKATARDSWTDWPDESSACMDYLHGDVIGGEYQAACLYEYARESTALRLIAEQRDRPEPIAEKYGPWIVQDPWPWFWSCPSFPLRPWNQVPEKQRAEMLSALAAQGVPPLRMMRVGMLNALGVFDRFKAMAKATPRQYPILELPEHFAGTLALFNLDFTEPKKRMLARFAAWLDLPENKHRLNSHRRDPRGTTGASKDRLKDLAVWRLYDKLGFNGMLDFASKHRMHFTDGRPRPFHDARQEQSKKQPLDQAPLCSEESFALKAKARAKKYLAEINPWEFGRYAEEEKQQLEEWVRQCRKRAAKISKRNF